MLLVEKKRIYEQLVDSNVIITAFEEDKLSVTELMTEFNIVGLNYVFLSKGKSIDKDYWYWKACEENIRRASCIVMVLSKTFFLDENLERRESFWYEVGLMEAMGKTIMPYFIGIERNEWDRYLSSTPIRQMQATNNIGELVAQIEQTRAFKKSFFRNREVAYYGNARVFYSRLSVLFNIKKDVIDSIFNRLMLLNDDEIRTKGDILNLLHREVNFGMKLFRFGRTCFIEHPAYTAYRNEAVVLDIDCNAINADNRFSLLSQNINNSSFLVKVDYILPNHEVLGVSVKPYLEISKNSVIRKGDLLNFLKHENGEEIFNNKLDVTCESTPKTERIYFNLYFEDDNMLVSCNDEKLGKTCNFLYAK